MPDAAGNIKGIALGGKAGETLERIRQRERIKRLREAREADPKRGYTLVACACGTGEAHHPLHCPLNEDLPPF